MKKLTAIILCLVMLFGMVCLYGCKEETKTSPEASTEATEQYTESNELYAFKERDDGTLEIAAYLGSEEAPELPTEFNGKAVTAIGEAAFQGLLCIKTLNIPEGIEEVCDYAFECCAELTSASFPASLKAVGKGAFSGCVSLENVSASEGLEQLGDGAFFFCKKLQGFDLPSTVKTVGAFVFAEDTSLANVTICEGLPMIGERMFWGCTSLQSLELPESVESIGDLAFSKCENLSALNIPEGVQSIGKYAFSSCGMLTSITLPTATISRSACFGCYGMENITISDNVTKIEKDAFRGTSSTDFLYIPASVTEIEPGAFNSMNCKGFTVDESNPAYASVDGVIYSKDMTTLIAYPAACENTEYQIPETVTTIEGYAFAGVYNLAELTLPETVTTLNDYALYEICNAETVTIPETVKNVGVHTCDSLSARTLNFFADLTELPEGTFFSSNSENIVLSDKLETVGANCFTNCGGMIELTLPKSLKTIPGENFAGLWCTFASESENFKVDENGALYSADGKTLLFYPVNGAEEITIPAGVEAIGDYAINCRGVKSVSIGEDLKQIGECGLGHIVMADSFGVHTDPAVGMVIYGPADSPVREYAAANQIGFFTDVPALNQTELTLAGDETAQLSVINANPEDIVYSCFDEAIATVDENGVVTAHTAGQTTVYAAVGATYFKCDLTVTSDGTPNPDAIDTSKYADLAMEDVPAWMERYTADNEGNISLEHDKNAFSAAYKGENYFEGIWAAQVEESPYDKGATDLFGEGFRPQLAMMGHGLAVELSRYENNDDLVLYSGTESFDRFVGGTATMKALRDSIGTTITEPYFLSTALEEAVTPTFAGPYTSVFIIYADKEAIDGGYIELPVGQGAGGEYELLLKGGATMEVLNAGVREIAVENVWTGEIEVMYERYMKLHLTVPEN